jgi:hypothetical protein
MFRVWITYKRLFTLLLVTACSTLSDREGPPNFFSMGLFPTQHALGTPLKIVKIPRTKPRNRYNGRWTVLVESMNYSWAG